MAIFSPTSAFSSVDLPALGRPMIATKPERKAIRSGSRLARLCSALWHFLRTDAQPLHSASGGLQNLIAQAVVFRYFSRSGDASQDFAHQPGPSGGVVAFRTDMKELGQAIHIHVAGHDVRVIALAHDVGLGFVLIANLPHDLFY